MLSQGQKLRLLRAPEVLAWTYKEKKFSKRTKPCYPSYRQVKTKLRKVLAMLCFVDISLWLGLKDSSLKKLYFLNYECRFDWKKLVPMLGNVGLGKDTT